MKSSICGAALAIAALAGCNSHTSTPSPATFQQIAQSAHTPLEKAAALLPWAAETVVVGTPNLPLSDAATLLPIFRARAGGGSCGLFATFYQDVLTRVGVPALTINVGEPQGPTNHVTTLVWDHGTFYVFDPTYNGRFLDSAGHDLPLPAILSDHSVVMHSEAVTRGVVYPIGDVADPSCRNLRPSSPTMATCEMIVTANDATAVAKASGLPGDFVGALLRTRVLSVGPSTPQQRTALAQVFRNARIPNGIVP